MLSSIFSNPDFLHLIEIFFWMLGAFLIGLFFGQRKTTDKNNDQYNLEKYEDLNIQDDISKIRATKTFERGGKEPVNNIQMKIQTNDLNYERFGKASFIDKNNLQHITGIGESIEEKLNNIDIYTYKQISNFNESDIHKISELINFPVSKIESTKWVEQAYELENKKELQL